MSYESSWGLLYAIMAGAFFAMVATGVIYLWR